MWIIIGTTVPVVLAIYGLSRLQQNRNSHGAQGPTGSAFTFEQFYKHENPDLRRKANILQSAEENDAAAHKYRVKWDSDEEGEQSSTLPLSADVVAAGASGVKEPKQTHKHKSKQAEVKWDAFDVRRDISLSIPERIAPPDAILLFDGVFLQRPELVDQWDYRIFVDVTMEEALQRAMKRDLSLFGSPEAVQARYLQRYFPGQQLYLQAVHPKQRADVVVENNDPAYPQLIFPLK